MADVCLADATAKPNISATFARAVSTPGIRYPQLLSIAERDGMDDIAVLLRDWIDAERRHRIRMASRKYTNPTTEKQR